MMYFVHFSACPNSGGEVPQTNSGLSFKENKGQIGDQFSKPRPDILFAGSSGELNFYLRNSGVSYQIYQVEEWNKIENTKMPQEKTFREVPGKTTIYRLDINWLHANPKAEIKKNGQVEGYENFYNVYPAVTKVTSYSSVVYHDLYKGIDLKWYEKDGNLKYDYIVSPGVDHKQIQLEIKGADQIYIDKNNALIIKTPLGILTEKEPYVTQVGKKLKAKWSLNKNIVSFDILNVDETKPLTIDPLVRLWGSYYGGNNTDNLYFCEADISGNIYSSGYTESQNNIATLGAHQTLVGGGYGNALLVKFNSAGVRQWATYYGGNSGEYAQQCAVSNNGNYVAMTGVTSSTLAGVIATPGSHQTNYAGGPNDAFLVLFDADGTRQWGTYYGGGSSEWGNGCDFDQNDNIYMIGYTSSTVGLSSPGSNQPISGGDMDGFLVKFNSAGTRLWATYYGGPGWEWLTTCKANAAGDLFITGYSQSASNISTSDTYQPVLVGSYGWGDAIIAKFSSSGLKQWATYYGGRGPEVAYNCVLDEQGNVYVAGTSCPESQTLTTTGVHQEKFGGGSYDAFLLKLSPLGQRIWCTYYGGKYDEHNNWCSMDPAGNIYLFGCTSSSNNISTSCSYQTAQGGNIHPPFGPVMSGGWRPVGGDVYVAKFTQEGARVWGTYYGGRGFEGGIAWDVNCTGTVDGAGNIYIVGTTFTSTGTIIASPDAHQPVFGGGKWDGFIVKFDACFANASNVSDPANMKVCLGDSTQIAASPTCVTWYNEASGGNAIGGSSTLTTNQLYSTTTFYVSDESCGPTPVRTAITVTVDPLPIVSVNNPSVVLCREPSVNLIASGATTYSWSPNISISCTNCPDPYVSPTEKMEYCVTGVDSNYCVGKTCASIEVYASEGHNFSLPNAFTPNGDGINESFCLLGWDQCNESFHIMIFDRWGEKVFESTNPDFCWTGIYKGQFLTSDVYIYSITAHYKDGTEVNKKGNITLIR